MGETSKIMKLYCESIWINQHRVKILVKFTETHDVRVHRCHWCLKWISVARNSKNNKYKIKRSKWGYVRRVCEIKARASVSRKMSGAKDFSCIGGLEKHIRVVKETVLFPLLYGDVYAKFNLKPPRGLLFYGPPGKLKRSTVRNEAQFCGKHDSQLTISVSQVQERPS